MTTVEAARRLTVLSLLETAARLQVRVGVDAAKLARDCWCTIAELETGCPCIEAAQALIKSAEHWLEGQVAA
jgi:hypothetical protein